MSKNLIEISDESFEKDVIQSTLPVIVDFWAPWCAPCKSLTPILEELAEEFAGQVVIGKVNVDDNQITPQQFNIRSIPNLIFFQNGQVINQSIGFQPKEQLAAAIKKIL